MATLPTNYRQTTPYLDEILEETLRQKTTSPNMYAMESYGGNFPAMSLFSDYLKGARKRQAKEEKQIATSDEATARSLVMQLIQDKDIDISPSGDITRGAEPTDVTNMTMQDAINNPQLVTTEALAGTGQEPVNYRFGPEKDPNWWQRNVLGAQLKGEETDNIYDIMGKANIPIKDQLALMEMRKPTGEDEYTYEDITVKGVVYQLKKDKNGRTVDVIEKIDESESRAQGNYTFTYLNKDGKRVKGEGAGFFKRGKPWLVVNGKEVLASEAYPGIKNLKKDTIQTVKNIGEETTNKYLAEHTTKRFLDDEEKGWAAISEMDRIDELLTLISRSDTPEGAFGELTPKLINFVQSLGINIPNTGNKIENARLVQVAIAERTLENVKKLTGPITEKELAFLKKMLPGLRDTKDGQRAILLYSQFIYSKQANFVRYINEKYPNYLEDASAQKLRTIQKEYMDSNRFNESFLDFTRAQIKKDADALRQRLKFDDNYSRDDFNKDLDYLTKSKYNLPYVKEVFKLGR